MSNAVVKLDELADPMAFLTGARVPLTHLWPVPFRAVEWVVDRILIDAEFGPRFDSIRPETVIMLGLDCSDPDVARWVDRKIAAIYQHLPRYEDDIVANFCGAVQWNIGVVGYPIVDANQWRLRYNDGVNGGGWLILRHDCLDNIPCLTSNVPAARASLLRAFFGRRDV